MRLAIGTVQFGLPYGVANRSGQVRPDEARAILTQAKAAAVDTLDTAIAYGDSESVLGQIGVAGWKIVTKLPAVPEGIRDVQAWVSAQVKASLTRLGVTHLYAVLLHRPGQLLESGGTELAKALLELKARGWAEKIGVSVYDPQELIPLNDLIPLELIQAPLNILDRRLVDSGWLDRLKSAGVEVHVRSAFLQGLLLMGSEQRPSYFERWQWLWSDWQRWLADSGLTPLQACLRYALSVPGVDRVVVGVDGVAQLAEILAVGNEPLDMFPQWPLEPELINPSLWPAL